MKRFTALAVLALVSSTAAHAADITSSGLPTTTNTAGACYVRNVGKGPIGVQLRALLNFSPGFITPSFENCSTAPLAPGRTCVLLVDDLPDDVRFACSATVAGNARNVRGSIEVRAITPNGPKVVLADELR